MEHLTNQNTEVPIPCPYCGKGTIIATVLTTFFCRKEKTLYRSGIEMDGETMMEAYGAPSAPSMHITSYRCTSCKKRFFSHQFELVPDEQGNLIFVNNTPKKGDKHGGSI